MGETGEARPTRAAASGMPLGRARLAAVLAGGAAKAVTGLPAGRSPPRLSAEPGAAAALEPDPHSSRHLPLHLELPPPDPGWLERLVTSGRSLCVLRGLSAGSGSPFTTQAPLSRLHLLAAPTGLIASREVLARSPQGISRANALERAW